MEWFLANYTPPKKKQNLNISRMKKQKIYEKENWVRKFIPRWLEEFPCLKNTDNGMKFEIF